jgi:thiol-disulfide isomerase/thioredoxin
MEYEHEELFSPDPVSLVLIANFEEGRAFALYTNEEWEEILDESIKEETFLDTLATGLSLAMHWEKVERGELGGRPVWVLGGTARNGVVGDAAMWLEEDTLFLRRMEFQTGEFAVAITVEEFKPGVEVPLDLFKPPAAELIARRITVIPRGREILSAAWEKPSGLQSFILRKRVRRGYFVDVEQIVIYHHPFLRVEQRFRRSLPLGGQLLHLTIYELLRRVFATYSSPKETLIVALGEAFRLVQPAVITVVGLKEEVLRGRKVWHITARGTPGTDEPGPEWWVDQETLSIVRYAEPQRILRVEAGKQREWEIEYGDILSFEPNPEIPDGLFAVPENVPLRRLEFPEEFGPKEPQKVTLEGWEAFSFAKLEEAKAQGKIAVLYFTAAWCEGCHDLEARALQDPRVQAALQPLVRLVVDLTSPGGEAAKVANQYRVRVLPTLLFLDSQGNELGRITGSRSASFLLQEMRRILEGGTK